MVVFGVAISAVLTLFVVPAFYAAVARGTQSPQHVAREIEELQAPTPGVEPDAKAS